MAKCEICGKGAVYGRSIQHKHGGNWARRAPKTNRLFKANIQKTTFTLADGSQVQSKVCTRCLKSSNRAR